MRTTAPPRLRRRVARQAPEKAVAGDVAKSALRVLEILQFVAAQNGSATHTDIARGLRIPKSSLTSLLADLQAAGYVTMEAATGRYSLASQVLVLSQAYLRKLNIVRAGAPIVEALFRRLGEFVALAVPKGDEHIVVAAEAPSGPLAHSLQIGERGPMHCTATGKAILAFLPEQEAEDWLTRMPRPKATPHTRVTVPEIMEDLRQVRASGIGLVREEAILGITAIAAPVFNIAGRPIAALSAAGASARFTSRREAEVAQAVREAAAALSTELGWRPLG
nr:IclR family transcriptional regulator [Plastoroseomonas hellenica]